MVPTGREDCRGSLDWSSPPPHCFRSPLDFTFFLLRSCLHYINNMKTKIELGMYLILLFGKMREKQVLIKLLTYTAINLHS